MSGRISVLASLEGMDTPQLAELLRRSPRLAVALRGDGVFGRRPATLAGLADLVGLGPVVGELVASLDRFTYQLLALAAWHGGRLTRKDALAEAGTEHADELEAAARRLADLLLASRAPSWLTLRPAAAAAVRWPSARVGYTLSHLPHDQLGRALELLGQRAPKLKRDRALRLEASLSDPAVIAAAATEMPPDVRAVFDTLVTVGPQRLVDLGAHAPRGGRVQLTGVLWWLYERALLGVDAYAGEALVWQEVIVATQGGVFADWRPGPPAVDARPLSAGVARLPAVLAQLDRLLELWAGDPPEGLTAGGLGVRPVRAAAKQLGAEADAVGLLVHLAADLGLIGAASQGRSRGRGAGRPPRWEPSGLVDEWRGATPAHRWALLVQTWLDSTSFTEAEGLPERLDAVPYAPGAERARTRVLAALRALPPGTGVDVHALAERVDFAHPGQVGPRTLGTIVRALRLLGLVAGDGPVGLTGLGRALLDDPASLEAQLRAGPTTVTVQADHTVIAPPDLAPAVAARLARYAERESDAVLRLSEARVAAALDAGDTAEDVAAFLAEHATAALPQNVSYWLAELGRRHGRLRVGSVASYLRCDDPALLARAATVKAAKLRVLAPTVAVSSLSRDKLLAALRAKDLMPVAEDSGGAVLSARPARRTDGATRLPPLRGRVDEPDDLLELAQRLLAGGAAAPEHGHGELRAFMNEWGLR
jgi:hypothetical protein